MRLLAGLILTLLLASTALAAEVRRTLTLSGLTCAACSAAVTKALEQIEGVHEVRVSADRTQAAVIVDDAVPAERLVEAVTGLGYGARLAAPEPAGGE
jgi:copper chaperone CopZ